jgi:hypothetical protein
MVHRAKAAFRDVFHLFSECSLKDHAGNPFRVEEDSA